MDSWIQKRIDKLDRECREILQELKDGLLTLQQKRQERLYKKYTSKLSLLCEYRSADASHSI